ncbi:MAG: asparagine synthase (glutamine-hydrolyzing) [Solirubrobacteraceae bacterium]
MCGIAGWVGTVDADERVLRRMCEAIAHRGPDDEAVHIVPGRVGMGFRRLSIIDLKGGRQPIAAEDDRNVVTCNGEIYNFRELRERLRARGHGFRTSSDVEPIVHLYEESGVECLHELRGMFAVALWDSRQDRLLLARDRMGVKPLYWAEVRGGLLYASEPAAILASGLVQARPDIEALAQYMALQYVPPPMSGFSGIQKLAPGERLIWQAGKIRVERWWHLRYEPKHEPADLVAELDALLDDATAMRMVADVPVGAFLSGGIDSSLVTSYMAAHSTQVRTFSIDFPHARFSEGRYARQVSEIYGTRHEEFLVEPDIVPAIADAVRCAGEPFADPSSIPTYLLSELTRRQVTVALSGDGGDEAFAGYVRHKQAALIDRLGPLPDLGRPLVDRLGRLGIGRHGTRLLRRATTATRPRPDRYAQLVSHFTPDGLQRLCQPDFLEAAGGSRGAWDEVLALPDLDGVDVYASLDVATYLPGAVLLKVDRMSMAHALEVRSPLLDHRVQEYAARLPSRLKLRRGTLKWPLRALAKHRGMPDELVDRPKMGFGIPIGEWFRGDLRPWIEGILLDGQTADRKLFRQHEVERLLHDHVELRVDHTERLWSLAMLELWHRRWIDQPVTA